MSLGWLLPGGEISLLPGLEVEGVYWENVDREAYFQPLLNFICSLFSNKNIACNSS